LPSTRIATLLLVPIAALLGSAGTVAAQTTTCELRYELSGWSAIVKQYRGSGTVTCQNGESARVTLEVTGGGITFGKSSIEDGRGTFSAVRGIDEVFGGYVAAGGHGGATQSAEAWVMTKGEVSLTLTGTGRGVDVGFAFGSFEIRRRN
jgi:hypothetical protein